MGMLSSLSGYPEWLPEDRLVEQKIVRMIQDKFELFGFTPIETRSVEPLDVILSKGETDKEIYCLRRLQADDSEANKNIGLHFDLTIPFSRYILENRNKLNFPFRRYQIQKAWRGERPGSGRYREFLQADIDIVDTRPLAVQSDIEILQVIINILTELPIPSVNILINNRKLLEGFYRALGIEKIHDVLRIVDKLDKMGEEKVLLYLTDDLGLASKTAESCIKLGRIKSNDTDEIIESVRNFDLKHPLIDEGLNELNEILSEAKGEPGCNIIADLSIARGFDYYTGFVCEVKFADYPKYPTIAAGGRYDNLVSDKKVRLPGIGMSIGISRMLGLVLNDGMISASRKTPTCVLVAMISKEKKQQSFQVADSLRKRGIPCEIYPYPDKYGKQISYADSKGIPFVWFPDENGTGTGQIRDLKKREQIPADHQTWMPEANDLKVTIIKNVE